jgi:hypothetical protein
VKIAMQPARRVLELWYVESLFPKRATEAWPTFSEDPPLVRGMPGLDKRVGGRGNSSRVRSAVQFGEKIWSSRTPRIA